jgi:proteasome assembly chaperone (PAC2) family protein
VSIEETDERAAATATAPRVSRADIEAAIVYRHDTTGGRIVNAAIPNGVFPAEVKSLEVLSICLLVMCNGFTVIGKSAPVHPDNFNAKLGKELAYEDAVRQLWPLMGYALRDRLWRDTEDAMQFHRLEAGGA